jgi:tryptophan synthase alpha chain
MTGRIDTTFVKAKKAGRGTLGVFVTAGDPNAATTSALLDALVEIGVDFIELGMPFSDPMADGPAIQAASLRALKGGMTLSGTLDIAADFRKRHPNTPLILMGYYNPIYMYGNDRFITNALAAGVDGLIVVDLPPEEDTELCLPAKDAGLKFIRLVTPTSDETRLPAILAEASGFIYYVSVLGITGTKSADRNTISGAYQRIRAQTELPIVAGFGIRTPAQAAEVASLTDGAVVGSAVVEIIANNLADTPQEGVDDDIVQKVATFVNKLTKAISNEGMR